MEAKKLESLAHQTENCTKLHQMVSWYQLKKNLCPSKRPMFFQMKHNCDNIVINNKYTITIKCSTEKNTVSAFVLKRAMQEKFKFPSTQQHGVKMQMMIKKKKIFLLRHTWHLDARLPIQPLSIPALWGCH